MTENTTTSASCQNSRTIPVSCALHRGPRGFATLMVEQRGEQIVLDVQVSGGVQIILDEAAGAALFDVLGTWLACRDYPPVEIGGGVKW